MSLPFAELVKISAGRAIMLCRGKVDDIPCFSYIECSADGAKAMHRDYEAQKNIRDLSDYGKVIYLSYGAEPDDKAKEFLKNWLAANS